jgi:TusA-related sulfurtransferase
LTNVPQRGIFSQEEILPGMFFVEEPMNQQSAGIELDRSAKAEIKHRIVDQELNLKGKICPYTFIESMLTLEDMETNQILRIIVDYPPAVCDVPKSLKNEGYEILDVTPLNETDWAIVVRNRAVEGT